MIALVVAAGLAANKALAGQVEVSAVDAAEITAAVTDALNTYNKKNTPPAVSAVQVVDPEAGVPTADISQKNISDATTDSCGLKNNLRMISALDNSVSRTELDSHANMVCLGRHSIIIEDTGKTVDVKLFTPDYNAHPQDIFKGPIIGISHHFLPQV